MFLSLFPFFLSTLSVRMIPKAKSRKNFYTVAQLASTLGSMLPGGMVPIIIELQGNDYAKEKLNVILSFYIEFRQLM